MGWQPSGQAAWDQWCLELAATAAQRATCRRNRHGAVVVTRDRRIIATAWTRPPSGAPACGPGTCGADGGRCAAVHAAVGAVLDAAPVERRTASLYTTTAPCWRCATMVARAGVDEVIAAGGRGDDWDATRRLLLDSGLRVRVLDDLEGLPRLDLG